MSAVQSQRAVPVVKGLGTSWLSRGGSYWTRRAAGTFVAFLVFLISVVITVALAGAILRSVPVGAGVIAVLIIVGVVSYTFVRGWRALVLDPRRRALTGEPPPDRRRRRRGAGATAGSLGLVAFAGQSLAAAALVFSAPFCLGWGASWFCACLLSDYPGELDARSAWERSHGRAHPPAM